MAIKGNLNIKGYLEAGYPALYVLTQEPHRAEEIMPFDDMRRKK